MTSQMKSVADRLKGLRDVLDISVETAAAVCGISVAEYTTYETGTVDIPLSVLFCMSKKYNVDMTAFLSGDTARPVDYFVTKKDKGVAVDRLADYNFQSLAFGYANRQADPFLVTINPGDIPEIHYTTHPGQEFNYVIEGSVRIIVGEDEIILNEGDSLYFNSSKPHGMQNADDKRCRFLTVIL